MHRAMYIMEIDAAKTCIVMNYLASRGLVGL